MKKRRCLTVCDPEFICYPHTTYANAVIRHVAGDRADILTCSKYINCYFCENSVNHKMRISVFDHWCTAQDLMHQQFIDISKELCKKRKTDLVLMIKKCLRHDNYVLGQCNRAYIEEQADRNAPMFDFMVVGLDDIAHEFTLYGLDSEERFSCYRVDYQRFVEALFDTPRLNITFTLWWHFKGAKIALDLPNIIFELEDYVNSTHRRVYYTKDKTYGLAAMREWAKSFYRTAQSGAPLKEAYLNQFSVHKSYMKKRIAILASNGIVDPKWIEVADRVAQMGNDVLQLGRAFCETRDMTLIDRLVGLMEDTVRIETDYLPHVLEELKKHNQTK